MTEQLTSDAPQRFIHCFVLTAGTFPGQHDGLKQESYFQTLEGLPIGAVELAAVEIRKSGDEFLPAAGVWFRLADDIAAQGLALAKQKLLEGTQSEQQELALSVTAYHAMIATCERLFGKPAADAMRRGCAVPSKVPTFCCGTCCDTGWLTGHCVEDDQCESCQRRVWYGEHTFVVHCHCFESNPELERRRAIERAHVTRRRGRRSPRA